MLARTEQVLQEEIALHTMHLVDAASGATCTAQIERMRELQQLPTSLLELSVDYLPDPEDDDAGALRLGYLAGEFGQCSALQLCMGPARR
jgi:hypothetical protein